MKEIESSEDFDDEEFEDETLVERLWALSEMFPEPVRNLSSSVVSTSAYLAKSGVTLGRGFIWVAATSFTVLILPVICEQERSTLEEQTSIQQRELLLGPSAAASASPSSMPGMPFGQMSPVK